MISAEQLKIKVKNKAKNNNVAPQDLMQMYFFERLLYRISISKYKNNFILKGGLLLATIIGDERRTIQDMDTMLKGIDLTIINLTNIMNEIFSINCDDKITFKIIKVEDIREQDIYSGLRIHLTSHKEHLIVPLKIDVTTKDPITPSEIDFKYKSIFDDYFINIMSFTKETIIAEKFETFLTNLSFNTRAKDFYNIYILLNEYYDEINKDTLVLAITNTCKRRNTLNSLN